ncbi:MAG: PepSY-like domain-containing protein [Bacteroidales bacterium]
MNKIFVLLFSLLFAHGVMQASDGKLIEKSQLPVKSQQFLNEYFNRSVVSYVKEDEDFFNKEYDVVFTDGTKIEFAKNGEWKSISCKQTEVPLRLVPAKIINHLKTNHPGYRIMELEKDRRGYELKLTNGLELNFDKNFVLTEIDD